jgi:hypothetical protein
LISIGPNNTRIFQLNCLFQIQIFPFSGRKKIIEVNESKNVPVLDLTSPLKWKVRIMLLLLKIPSSWISQFLTENLKNNPFFVRGIHFWKSFQRPLDNFSTNVNHRCKNEY